MSDKIKKNLDEEIDCKIKQIRAEMECCNKRTRMEKEKKHQEKKEKILFYLMIFFLSGLASYFWKSVLLG